jgi:peptide/nickel transport system permease protein
VAAARISGVSEPKIMARHILPAVLRTAIVQASFVAASALHFVVALGYLGLTASPGQPDWGQMVAVAATQITNHPWLLVPPGALIALTVLALILFGNALRDASANVNQVAVMAEPALPAAPPTPVATVKDVQIPAPDALLAVRNLSVVFSNRKGQTRIVDGVSFDVRPGETVGLMGESGAGKSITALAILRLLPGTARLTGGQVFFGGRDLVALNDHEFNRLRGTTLGLVSQEPLSSLDPTFTVGSQLGELVRRHDRVSGPKLKARCLELLGQVQLPDPARVLKSYPHELSGGMAQRVALAMALAGRPRLLIADEPTTALDVTVQKEILALLRQIQRETGMAILIVTHNFGVVADICDRVFVMYAGQVFEEAGVYELFRRPLNPYSQGLLRANPANAQPGHPLQVIPGRVPSPGNWPPGCRFAPRCPFAQPECAAGFIPLVETGQGRLSRCIRLGELVEKEFL